jgi:hypothetical protein
MRPVMRVLILIAAVSSIAFAAPLTIVLDFLGPHSERSVAEMKREFEHIMKDSGMSFEWRLRAEAGSEAFANLVLVRFRGKCILEPDGYLYDERGPLAFTHSTEGAVQPFSEVECEEVTASVRAAMPGSYSSSADTLLGRALGRVLAHELVHILTRAETHGKKGVTVPSLTGRSLIASELPLSPEELERLRASGDSTNRR